MNDFLLIYNTTKGKFQSNQHVNRLSTSSLASLMIYEMGREKEEGVTGEAVSIDKKELIIEIHGN